MYFIIELEFINKDCVSNEEVAFQNYPMVTPSDKENKKSKRLRKNLECFSKT